MDELEFIRLFMAIFDCTESHARSVFIHVWIVRESAELLEDRSECSPNASALLRDK